MTLSIVEQDAQAKLKAALQDEPTANKLEHLAAALIGMRLVIRGRKSLTEGANSAGRAWNSCAPSLR